MDIFKLVGSVFVDTDKANDSLSKTDKKASGLGDTLGKGIKTAGKWAIGLGTAAAAVGGAMIKSAKDTASNLDVIDKASQRMKIGAESYQELAYAAGLCGVEMSTMEKAAKKLEGTDMNMDDALASIYELETAEERSAKAAELFGEAVAYQMTPMLNASAEDMAAMRQEANDLGLVMSEDTVKAGAEMNDSFEKIESSLGAVANKIGEAVMPIVQKLLDWILEHMPEIQEVVGKVFDFIGDMVPVVIKVIKSLTPVIKVVFNIVKTLWDTVLKPVLNIILSVIDGTFKEKFIDAFDKIKQKVSKIFEDLKAAIKVPINGIIGFINGMVKGVVNGINSMIEAMNKLKFDVPDWIPLIGGKTFGFDLKKLTAPQIPLLAKGGDVVGSGKAIVGEAGAELIDLPNGARVTPLTRDGRELLGTDDILSKMDAMMDTMETLIREVAKMKHNVVLDSGALVGQIAPDMDKALGSISNGTMRGVYA